MVTGPEVCPSLGPTAPGAGGEGAEPGEGPDLPWPASPLPLHRSPRPPPAPKSLTLREPLSPSAPGAARSPRGGGRSPWPGVGPPAGLRARLGIPCLLLSVRGPAIAEWTDLAAGAPGSAAPRPGSRRIVIAAATGSLGWVSRNLPHLLSKTLLIWTWPERIVGRTPVDTFLGSGPHLPSYSDVSQGLPNPWLCWCGTGVFGGHVDVSVRAAEGKELHPGRAD